MPEIISRSEPSSSDSQCRKNVILLHTDQQRYDSLGCCGNSFARTPNLDRLAAEGTLFTRHIVSNPICSPSRASLLTGLYPPGHNLWCNGVALNRREYARVDNRYEGKNGFCAEPMTIADHFAAAGYDTASFGKLHLTPYMAPEDTPFPESAHEWATGRLDDWHGPYYGFRHVDLTISHGDGCCDHAHYGNWLKANHPEALRRVQEGGVPKPLANQPDLYPSTLPFELHHSTWLADRAIDYLKSERPADRPFFAFVGFPDPHHPFTPSAEIVEEFLDADVHEPLDFAGRGTRAEAINRLCQRAAGSFTEEHMRTIIRYTYAMVYQIDLAVGRILQALEDAGLAENTIVAFTSDHGDFLGDHGRLYKSFGAVNSLLHVPLIIRTPGAELPERVDAPVSNCDVMPTLAALAGVPIPARLDGINLASRPSDHCAFAFSSNMDPESRNFTVYDDRYRLTWYPTEGYVELYDHEDDPAEVHNLAAEPAQAARVAELQERVSRQLAASYNPILGRWSAW
jgi:arylsulfatase A-like enzyme